MPHPFKEHIDDPILEPTKAAMGEEIYSYQSASDVPPILQFSDQPGEIRLKILGDERSARDSTLRSFAMTTSS